MKNWISKIPHLYFIGIICWIYFGNLDNQGSSALILLFILPFAYQLLHQKNWLNLVLASITGFYAFWMILAYFSEIAKSTTTGITSFIIGGALFLIANLIMVYLLFRSGLPKEENANEYSNLQAE